MLWTGGLEKPWHNLNEICAFRLCWKQLFSIMWVKCCGRFTTSFSVPVFCDRGWVLLCLCSCCGHLLHTTILVFCTTHAFGMFVNQTMCIMLIHAYTFQLLFLLSVWWLLWLFQGTLLISRVFKCIDEGFSENYPSSDDMDVCQNFNWASCFVRKVYNYKVGCIVW